MEKIKEENQELWILASSVEKFTESFVIKRWRDVKKDMTTPWPDYFDIKQIKKGVMRRPDATEQNENEKRGTKSCIIQFRKQKA